jgi:hypothetical protein
MDLTIKEPTGQVLPDAIHSPGHDSRLRTSVHGAHHGNERGSGGLDALRRCRAQSPPTRWRVRAGQTWAIVAIECRHSDEGPTKVDFVSDSVIEEVRSERSVGYGQTIYGITQSLWPEPSFSRVQGAASRHACSFSIRMSVGGGAPPLAKPNGNEACLAAQGLGAGAGFARFVR